MEQLCARYPEVRAARERIHQDTERSRTNFGIAVQQQQNWPRCLPEPVVGGGGKAAWGVMPQDARARRLSLNSIRRSIRAPVVYDDDLEVHGTAGLEDGVETPKRQIASVSCRDDD
jgi:hypothetical protein